MSSVDLTGRVPQPRPTISGRLLGAGIVVFLLVVAAVVYGFHFRLIKQQARKQAQQTQLVASDAATSNRQSVEGEVPASALATPPSPATAPGGSITTPLVNAAQTVAHPFPGQQGQTPAANAQPVQAPVYYAPPEAPPVDAQEELRKQALAHRYARQQEAFEAPTGPQEKSAPATDPTQADAAQFNSLLHPAIQAPPAAAPSSVLTAGPDAGGYGGQNAQGQKRQFDEGGEGPGDCLKTMRVAQLKKRYGDEGAVTIMSQAFTNIVLRTGDPGAAKHCEMLIGHHEIERITENRPVHMLTKHRARSWSNQTVETPVVTAAEIQGLPRFTGYLLQEGKVVRIEIQKLARGVRTGRLERLIPPVIFREPPERDLAEGDGLIAPAVDEPAATRVAADIASEIASEAPPKTASANPVLEVI